ncbi:response regulator transcription factor [Pseudomonas sp.]|uniref:response regulator transcription factor n=1 Tax=Pseudomonas sp. TaxID=306 RepID=UPI003FD80C46
MDNVICFRELQGTAGLLATQEMRATLAVCSGLANKEIAKALGCSAGTVKKTLERVFFKLGVTRRAAAVAKAFAMGLISFSGGMIPAPQRQQEQGSTQGIFVA